jgi:hypothetical protein
MDIEHMIVTTRLVLPATWMPVESPVFLRFAPKPVFVDNDAAVTPGVPPALAGGN